LGLKTFENYVTALRNHSAPERHGMKSSCSQIRRLRWRGGRPEN
jgi:hypothetical protein